MTATVEAEAPESTEVTEAPKKRGRPKGEKQERDFTKYTEAHESLANYINADEKVKEAGLEISPNLVKAVLALRTEWADTPERKAEREERKRQREEEKKQFAGMSDEEIKAEKAARRAERTAQKMQAKVAEALARAAALREGKDLSGADLAAAVESAQNGSDSGEKRRITRKK
jgi:hypothetical protein